MGAWGVENFDNDAAMDWIGDFVDAPLPDTLDAALRSIVESSGAEEMQNCEEALAAAEVVAALNDQPSAALPDDAKQLLAQFPVRATKELLQLATDAVALIVAASELQELWDESEHLDAWLEVQTSLLERLGGTDQ